MCFLRSALFLAAGLLASTKASAQFGAPLTPYTVTVVVPEREDVRLAPTLGGIQAATEELRRRLRLDLHLHIEDYESWPLESDSTATDGVLMIAPEAPPPAVAARLRTLDTPGDSGGATTVPLAVVGPAEAWPGRIHASLEPRLFTAQLAEALASGLRSFEDDVAIILPEGNGRLAHDFRTRLVEALEARRPGLDLQWYKSPDEPEAARAVLQRVVADDRRARLDMIVVLEDAGLATYRPPPWEAGDYTVLAAFDDLRVLRHFQSGHLNHGLSADRFSLGKAALTALVETIHLGETQTEIPAPPWIEVGAKNVVEFSREWSNWIE
ncbi:MAG: hypothetical protein ACFB21_01105 [Opitutales bacterium]